MSVAQVFRADSGAGELIVWLVVTVIWIVAQAVTRSRKKQDLEHKAPTRPPPPAQQPEDLDEFFKLLRQQFEADKGAAAAPPPVPRSVPQPRSTPRAAAASTVTRRRIASRPTPPPPPPMRESPATAATATTPWAQELPPVPPMPPPAPPPRVSSESVRRDMLSLKVGFSSRGLRLPDVRIASKFHRRAAPDIQPLFHGRQGLRRAVIARQVLGAPRSVRPWLYPED